MRARRRVRRASGLAVLLLGTLTACGEPTTDDYCARLDQDRRQLGEMVDSGSPTALLDNLELLEGLAELAPSDLEDEWQTFLGALEDLQQALSRADVTAGDFEDGKAPAGLDEADRRAIVLAAGQVRSDEVVGAAAGIEQQARDVCKLNLGL